MFSNDSDEKILEELNNISQNINKLIDVQERTLQLLEKIYFSQTTKQSPVSRSKSSSSFATIDIKKMFD